MAGMDVLATAFSGANAAFIADLYARWVANPSSVDPSFGELFSALNDEARSVLTDASGASWAPRPHPFSDDSTAAAPMAERRAPPGDAVRAADDGIRSAR